MKKANKLVAALLGGLLIPAVSCASGKVHWGYSGEEGPAHWSELSPAFSACAAGRNQSPVNLAGMIEGDLPELKVNYVAGGNEIVNNGHTIQINYAPGSTISVKGHSFELKQFHFHSPSENEIDGRSYPMEAHFVHADKDGNLAVLAVMFESGSENAELARAWKSMPPAPGERRRLEKPIDASILLPADHDYYRFNGSLTTPPCTEGVRWYVMKSFDSASNEQIEKFAHAMHHANNRPVQPLNARVLVQ